MRIPRMRFTLPRILIFTVGAPAAAAVLVAALLLGPAGAAQPQEITLLKTLAEWKYPRSTMSGGASMSDGGNPLIQSVKCRAILTTPDPIEKVIEFYSEKLGLDPATGRQAARREVKESDAKSVYMHDDSEGRPITLRVIVVNKADTATTLVISRANGEKETHIAWLHYVRLDGKR